MPRKKDYWRNPEHYKKYNRDWNKKHPKNQKQKERNRLMVKKWREEHPDYYREYNREYQRKYQREHYQYNEEKREYHKKHFQEWKEKNLEHRKEYNKEWRLNHPKRIKEWRKQRRLSDFKYRLDCNIATAFYQCLKSVKAGRHWEILVDYTIEDLIKHLESLFDEKMNWDNYGSYWHIDHKIPKSLFKYKTAEDPEFKKCWALSNLQPMEAIENIRKSNKIAN